MNLPTLSQLEMAPWFAVAVYFIVSSAYAKQDRAPEALRSRAVHTILAALGAAFLFNNRTALGLLAGLIVPRGLWWRVYGVMLTWAGIALALWARQVLGEYWSARITVKEDHELIRSGPYAFVRHPIYTGILLAAAGRAIFVGRLHALVGVLFLLATFVYKAQREESRMVAEFGPRYRAYREGTGFLIPRFH